MKTLLLLLFLFLSAITSAQFTFERSYQFYPNSMQNASGIIEDGLGGYYITSSCPEINQTKAVVSHLNSVGDTLWNTVKVVPNVLTDPTYCGAIIKTQDGNLLIHGNMGDTSTILQGGHWLMKLDTSGNVIWFKANFNMNIDFHAYGENDYLHEFNNKNILLYVYNGFFALFDSSGIFISAKYPPFKNSMIYRRHQNIKNYHSNFILHGKKVFTNYTENTFFKVNSTGDTLVSIITQEDSSYDSGMEYSKFNDNWFYIVGRQQRILTNTPSDDRITKLDSLGNIIWRKKYKNGFPNGLVFTSFKETLDTGLIIAGFKPVNGTYCKPFLYKIKSNGDSLWYKEFGNGSNFSRFSSLITTSDGGFAIVGETTPIGSSYSQSYIVKTDANGIILNVLDELQKKNQNYLHLYPNPSNTVTSLHYMGTSKNALLKIYTLQGKVVYDELLNEDDVRIFINTSTFAPGFYVCKVMNGNAVLASKKLVVIR